MYVFLLLSFLIVSNLKGQLNKYLKSTCFVGIPRYEVNMLCSLKTQNVNVATAAKFHLHLININTRNFFTHQLLDITGYFYANNKLSTMHTLA